MQAVAAGRIVDALGGRSIAVDGEGGVQVRALQRIDVMAADDLVDVGKTCADGARLGAIEAVEYAPRPVSVKYRTATSVATSVS